MAKAAVTLSALSALPFNDDGFRDAFCDSLAVGAVLEIAIILRIRNKPQLAKNSRTTVLPQNVKIIPFDPSALGWIRANGLAKNVGGEAPRSWAEVINLHAACPSPTPPIVVNAHENAVTSPVGNRSSR